MRTASLIAIACLIVAPASAQTEDRVRTRMRSGARAGGTTVDQAQAEALTLTLSAVSPRPVQAWIRTAGTIDKTGRVLRAQVTGSDATLIRAGQRVRAFPPSSKSSMYQAFVTRVSSRGDVVDVEVSLASAGRPNTSLYVLEIVVEQGPYLSVPNEAIIEEGDKQVVYVKQPQGQYLPQEIHTGLQGELYTQILGGVKDGDQVVTFGSFFIDAEQKLKGTTQNSPSSQRE
jgi:hypothetical protein